MCTQQGTYVSSTMWKFIIGTCIITDLNFIRKTVESFEQSDDYLHWQRDKSEAHADFFVLISFIV